MEVTDSALGLKDTASVDLRVAPNNVTHTIEVQSFVAEHDTTTEVNSLSFNYNSNRKRDLRASLNKHKMYVW